MVSFTECMTANWQHRDATVRPGSSFNPLCSFQGQRDSARIKKRCLSTSVLSRQLHLCKALIIAQPRVSIVILWHQQAWHIANCKETSSPHEDKLCSFSSHGSVSVGKKGLRGESIFEIWGEVEESHTYTHSPSPPLHLNKITVTGRINNLAVYRVSYHVKVPQGSF